MNVFEGIQNGYVGSYGEYMRAYRTYTQLHNQIEALFAVNGGKKYKVKPPSAFEEVYPDIFDMMTLGRKGESLRVKSEDTVAKNAAVAVVDSNAPDWLRQLI